MYENDAFTLVTNNTRMLTGAYEYKTLKYSNTQVIHRDIREQYMQYVADKHEIHP